MKAQALEAVGQLMRAEPAIKANSFGTYKLGAKTMGSPAADTGLGKVHLDGGSTPPAIERMKAGSKLNITA